MSTEDLFKIELVLLTLIAALLWLIAEVLISTPPKIVYINNHEKSGEETPPL